MNALKLSDIVKVTGIDTNTAQYVLKRGNVLPTTPRSRGQGKQRNFNLRQAVQLAVCTLLVRGGTPRDKAGWIVEHCETMAERSHTKRERAKNAPLLYQSSLDDPWILTIDDHRFCRLWRKQIEKETHLRDEEDFIDLETGEIVLHYIRGYTRFEVTLTTLEGALWNKLRLMSEKKSPNRRA